MEKSATRGKPDGHAPATSACDQCRARKIKCNREQPKCLNCDKVGSGCTFSGRPKRVNHTRKLVDDFSTLEARLESIDHSVNTISRRLSSATHTPTLVPSSPETYQSDLFVSERQSQTSEADHKVSQQQDNYRPIHKKFDDRGGERYYGSTAAVSLVESSQRILGEILRNSETNRNSTVGKLVARDLMLKNELQRLFDNFPILESCHEPDFRADGKAVSHPPRSFINSILDTYLDTIHVTRPIFQESGLRSAIDQHNAGNDVEPIEATKLCFNNIIILTLGLKLRQRRCTEPESHGMDDDLLLSFLKNSGRAFGYLSLFLEPRLRNVQALATLAMVAREYWESHVFERVCHLACHVAKSMGLLQRPANEAGSTPERNATRIQLFWVLYVMDKERTFMTGVPCDLYFFDSDIQLHEEETGATIQNYAVAHYHIMSLWEDIYVSLYSSRAVRSEASQRAQQVSRLHELFRSWGFKYKALLRTNTDPGESTKECFQLELKYCFHIGQILIHHCGREETNKEQRLNSMYFALNLIQEVYRKTFSLPHFALLGRLFRYYPSIAFLDLYTKILQSPTNKVDTDVQLLTRTADTLSVLKDPSTPAAYYNRLHVGMTWCIQVATRVASSLATSTRSLPQESSPEAYSTSKMTPISKPPSLSPGSSTPSSSSITTKVPRTPPPPEDSPHSRKKPLPPQLVSNTRATPWASAVGKHVPDSTLSDPAPTLALDSNLMTTSNLKRDSTTTAQEEVPAVFPTMPDATSMLPPLSADFFDWNIPMVNNDSSSMLPMSELSNFSDLNAGLGMSHDADMADFIMSQGGGGGMTIDPWDVDF